MKEIRRADGMFLRYQEKGVGTPPMVLVHGMGTDHERMAPLVEYYKSRFRVIAYDTRGCGGSAKPQGDYSVSTLADDLGWVIDELRLDRPVIVGHSLGGSTCLNYAVRHPEKVRALVLLDSGIRDLAEKKADLSPFYDRLGGPDHADVIKEYALRRLYDPGDDPEIALTGAEKQMFGCAPHAFIAMGKGVLGFDAKKAAAACKVPTLFILSDSPYTAPATVEWLSGLPGWYVGKVIGSGHAIQLIVPDQVTAMMDRFLEILDHLKAAEAATRPAAPRVASTA